MANLLTALRLILIAPVAYGLAYPGSMPGFWLTLLLFLAIASDYIDGKVARALGSASANGMLFDHSTDFLFVTTSMAALAFAGAITPLLPLLVVIAFSQYVLDSYFLFKQKQLKMSYLGRWNGVFYFGPALLFSFSLLPLPMAVQSSLLYGTSFLSYCLIASTALSIIDRGIAPLRRI